METSPIKPEISKKDKISKYEKRAYYSFATIILLIGIFIVSRSLYLNVKKYFTFKSQLSALEKIHHEQKDLNDTLKAEIKQFNTLEGIEAIARNRLKMAEKDEVLVIIKKNKKEKSPSEEGQSKPL